MDEKARTLQNLPLVWLALLLVPCAAAINVSVCGNLDSNNASYTVTANLSTAGGGCLAVIAENVTLDCQGYYVTGDQTLDSAGIAVTSFNATIRNCYVTGFDHGIDFTNAADNGTVLDSLTENNSAGGLAADGPDFLNVSNLTLDANQNGLKLVGSDGNIFHGLRIQNSDSCGIYWEGSSDNRVENTSIQNSSSCDVYVNNSDANTFLNTSFNRSFVDWEGGSASNFTVKWLVNVSVQNATGGMIANANVNFSDAYTLNVLNASTDANGQTGYLTLTEYKQDGTQVYGINETTYTPHQINASVAGYYFSGATAQNSTNVTVDRSMDTTVVVSGSWSLVQGSFDGNVSLRSGANDYMMAWANASPSGFVFAVPQGGNLNLSNLAALSRNQSGVLEPDDFDQADALLNLSGQTDSIYEVFGNGSGTPQQTRTFNLAGFDRTNVPIVNSTNSSAFLTGILWDATTVGAFTQASAPTLVFVGNTAQNGQGRYGVHDFELRLPHTLDAYHGGTMVELYVEVA